MANVDPIPELKRQLAAELVALVNGMSAENAAAHMYTDRWRVADIRAGRLERFSLETLIRFTSRMHRRVELNVVNPRFEKLSRKPAVT